MKATEIAVEQDIPHMCAAGVTAAALAAGAPPEPVTEPAAREGPHRATGVPGGLPGVRYVKGRV